MEPMKILVPRRHLLEHLKARLIGSIQHHARDNTNPQALGDHPPQRFRVAAGAGVAASTAEAAAAGGEIERDLALAGEACLHPAEDDGAAQ